MFPSVFLPLFLPSVSSFLFPFFVLFLPYFSFLSQSALFFSTAFLIFWIGSVYQTGFPVFESGVLRTCVLSDQPDSFLPSSQFAAMPVDYHSSPFHFVTATCEGFYLCVLLCRFLSIHCFLFSYFSYCPR